jgi:hypothetical protein
LDRDLFHLAFGEESDPLAVWREERIIGAFGFGKQCGIDLVERARRKLLSSAFPTRQKVFRG